MIKGYYINLESSTERREILVENLKACGVERNYQRFDAIKGDPIEASQLKLKAGELGLWKSWISLLNYEIKNPDKDYHYLHFIEDDVIMDEKTANALKICCMHNGDFDILFTDMYVNPSVHIQMGKYCKTLMQKEKVTIEKNIYTGCTSSAIIRKDRIQKIYNKLVRHISSNEKKIPIDNYIRRLMNNKELSIGTTVPFITSVRLDQIQNSTIQQTKLNHKAISISQALCTLMRRDLSYIRNPEDMYMQAGKYIKALEDNAAKKQSDKENDMIDMISKHCLDNKLMRYKYEPRLVNEAMNAQINEHL